MVIGQIYYGFQQVFLGFPGNISLLPVAVMRYKLVCEFMDPLLHVPVTIIHMNSVGNMMRPGGAVQNGQLHVSVFYAVTAFAVVQQR